MVVCTLVNGVTTNYGQFLYKFSCLKWSYHIIVPLLFLTKLFQSEDYVTACGKYY